MSELDYSATQDFDDVGRGFLGTLDDPLVRNSEGTVVWNAAAYDFITDVSRTYSVRLSNGALIHADKRPGTVSAPLVVTLTKPELLVVLSQGPSAVTHEGDLAQFGTLVSLLDTVDHRFPIVTP